MSQGDLNDPFLQRVSSDGAALLPLSDDSSKRTAVASSIADNEADAAAGGGGAVGNNNAYAASPSESYGSPSESKISAFVLAVMVFFSAAGGPFGVEPSLKAAGNLYAIIGFAVMPFIWALPEAWITYELSSIYPCASGGTRWVEEAFGESWGLLVGYLGWISGVTNNASYPVLFVAYIHRQFLPHIDEHDPAHRAARYGILAGITVLLTFVNYRGLHVVGKATLLIFFVSMAPFLMMVIIGIPKVDPSKWRMTPTGEEQVFDDDTLVGNGWFPAANLAGIAFRPFINNLFWNFNGFDQAGHYSNVVTKTTLRNGIGGTFFLVSSGYLLPILVATGATDLEQDDWNAGAFAIAGTEIGGAWLGNWIVVSAGISLLAQFFSEMTADSMQVQGVADRGQLPSLFSHRSAHDTPTYALLLGVAVILILLPLPFGVIIELSNFAFCLSLIMCFLAFAQLRIRNGDGSRRRKVLYAIMIIIPMLFTILVLLLASYATIIYGLCVTVLGILLINAKRIGAACGQCGCCGTSSTEIV